MNVIEARTVRQIFRALLRGTRPFVIQGIAVNVHGDGDNWSSVSDSAEQLRSQVVNKISS